MWLRHECKLCLCTRDIDAITLPRSNNHIEGYDGDFNKFLTKNANIYKFIHGIKVKEATQHMRYCKLEQGILKELCRERRDIRRDNKILSYQTLPL
jgi:hypothetical protein